jgi:hypothetical protein
LVYCVKKNLATLRGHGIFYLLSLTVSTAASFDFVKAAFCMYVGSVVSKVFKADKTEKMSFAKKTF